jgi:site-specific DNA recombinase
MPARVVSGPTLLTGMMPLRQMRRRDDHPHRQGWAISLLHLLDEGPAGRNRLQGPTIPMDKLDDLVVDHLEKRLLAPERLETILATVLDRRQARGAERRTHIAELNGAPPRPISGSSVSMMPLKPALPIWTTPT